MASRMTGFIPDRFVRMLSERIDDALKNKVSGAGSQPAAAAQAARES